MNRTHLISSCAAAAMVATSCVAPAYGQVVSDRVLSDVKADSTGGCSALTIAFNVRVQIVSSFPANGRELHVRLQPLDTRNANKSRESLRTPQTVPELRSIEYEGDAAAGPTLSLFFTQDMEFEVQPGQQPQTLMVRVAHLGSKACAESSPVAPRAIGTQPAVAPQGLYVVNLRSSPGKLEDLTNEQRRALASDVVYQSQFEKGAQTWHRLRAGFFGSREQADAERARLSKIFPDAWVDKATPQERAQSLSGTAAVAAAASVPTAAPSTGDTAASPAPAGGVAQVISDAEQAIQDNNLDRAIQLLTEATQLPESPETPRALELLGITRERKGQAAHARAEYEEYLRRYPQGEGADRVRQRLAALDAAGASGQGSTTLHQATGLGNTGKWTWGLRGSFSQFYFRDQLRTNSFLTSSTLGVEVDNSTNVNQLLTSGDVTISGGNDRRQFQLRAAGSYTKDFGTTGSVVIVNNGVEKRVYHNRQSLSALYLDYSDHDLNSQIRIGRQSRNSQGVLGRFDGALVGWQANPKLRFNVVGGFPVLSSRQTWVLKERPFYGVSVDLGSKRSPIQTTLYWFDQRAKGGFVDRQAVGIEARFLKPRFNAYGMVDYDVKFSQLNLALGTMTYNFPDGASFSMTADYRRSPLLTTTNALIGMFVAQLDPATGIPVYTLDSGGGAVQTFQAPTTLVGLKPFFTDPQIYHLALDRTIIAKSLTATYSRPITKKLQVSTDFSLTDTGGAPGTPEQFYTDSAGNLTVPPLLLYNGISALPTTGKEYYYGLQFIGSDMFMTNDIFILSGRLANTSTAKIYTADFNARVPITSNFRVSPRLRYGFRDGKVTSLVPVPGTYSQFQPTLRLNYYPVKHSEIEVEVGGNFSNQKIWSGTGFDRIDETGWVLSAGYRLDF